MSSIEYYIAHFIDAIHSLSLQKDQARNLQKLMHNDS